MEEQKGADEFTFAGKPFRAITDGTIQWDDATMREIRAARLDSTPMMVGETAERYALRLLDELLLSGRALPLIGCLVIPADIADEDWTPKIAEETSRFVGKCKGKEDREEYRLLLTSAMISFLESGLASLKTLETSSPAGEPEETMALTPEARSAIDSLIGSESGGRSSGS